MCEMSKLDGQVSKEPSWRRGNVSKEGVKHPLFPIPLAYLEAIESCAENKSCKLNKRRLSLWRVIIFLLMSTYKLNMHLFALLWDLLLVILGTMPSVRSWTWFWYLDAPFPFFLLSGWWWCNNELWSPSSSAPRHQAQKREVSPRRSYQIIPYPAVLIPLLFLSLLNMHHLMEKLSVSAHKN